MHIKKPEKYDYNLGEIRQNQEGDKITEGSAFQHKNVRLFARGLSSEELQRQGAILKAKLHGSKTKNEGGVFKSCHFRFPTSKKKAFFICLVDYEVAYILQRDPSHTLCP